MDQRFRCLRSPAGLSTVPGSLPAFQRLTFYQTENLLLLLPSDEHLGNQVLEVLPLDFELV